ncbi:hypothetical protein [Thalassobellus suaedae]|uniref:Glycosyltransferase 2-like domain-containing protein n=1 Tax=Thalassobellus suaedae TaxID=3074124 RepID=A0ABY9XUP5_9FLAO|nr:hypothetical protein RHP51_02570 [Flavobacteriaceae bacterium HL-DH14]
MIQSQFIKVPYSPHNLYCNELLNEVNEVNEGWIMFLDDDDMLAHKNVLIEIAHQIKKLNEDTLLIWQMRFPDGRTLPSLGLLRKKQIKLHHIGSPCFMFHSKYKTHVTWDSWKCADYRFVKQLSEEIPHMKCIGKTYVLLNNMGDSGNRNDID